MYYDVKTSVGYFIHFSFQLVNFMHCFVYTFQCWMSMESSSAVQCLMLDLSVPRAGASCVKRWHQSWDGISSVCFQTIKDCLNFHKPVEISMFYRSCHLNTIHNKFSRNKFLLLACLTSKHGLRQKLFTHSHPIENFYFSP